MSIPSGPLTCFLDETSDGLGRYMLLGGYFLPRTQLKDLDHALFELKNHFGLSPRDPIKWNLEDKGYEKAKKAIVDAKRYDEFRTVFLELVSSLDIRLLMAFDWKSSPSEGPRSWRRAFKWVLQRLAIVLDRKSGELKELDEYPLLDVVCDGFPDSRGSVDTYYNVYAQAFYEGFPLPYDLSPLIDKGACPCLLVSSCKHSQALQAADMFVGIVGKFFEYALLNKTRYFAQEYFTKVYPSFHSDGDKRVQIGLIVPKVSRAIVEEKLIELGLDP